MRPITNALLAVALGSALAASGPAFAGWSLTGDVEHFRWAESTSPSVTETGARFGIGAAWTQERPSGWQFAWRGRLYFGSVSYDGAFLFSGEPLSGTTEYRGIVNEGQAIYRFPGNSHGGELVGGLGLDYWERQLNSFQQEDYRVLFLRLGANFDPRVAGGWFGGVGIKYPLSVSENAHLRDIGFDQNPQLKPKGAVSLYAQAGYRFTRDWSLIGYYDSYRFKESDAVRVTAGGLTGFLLQPKSDTDIFGLRVERSF